MIRFCARYAKEVWEATNNKLVLFTIAEPGNDEVMINLQLGNGPELMTEQQGCSKIVIPQQLWDIMEWLLHGYQLYKDEAGEYALSLFYNQQDQENHYALYMSYLDATMMRLTRHLGAHGIEEYLIAYVQLLIRQLLHMLARHNIEIGDVMQFTGAQQNNTCRLLDCLNCSFLEVQEALVHIDNHVGYIHGQLDIKVSQLKLE